MRLLPTLVFPVIFAVPAMLAPVGVMTSIVFALAVRLILPLAVGIETLLAPLEILEELPPAAQVRLPAPSVCKK